MSYEIIKSDIRKDKDIIIDFWNKNNEKKLNDKFDWMYLSNPDGLASTWLIRHKDGSELVGMASVFPRRFRYRDKTFIAGIQGDFFIHSEHRSFGPALMLIRAILNSLVESNYDFLFGFPNKKADPIFKRAGYRNLGVTKKYVRLFDIRRLLSERTPIPGVLLGPISTVSNQLLKLVYPDAWIFNLGRFAASISDTFDFDIQYLSEHYHQNYFTSYKTRDYLKWKYEQDPDDENKFFVIKDASNQVVGCIVFCIEDNRYIQMREILHTEGLITLSALLSIFFKQVKKLNCEYAYVQIYENSALLSSSNNLDLTISDQGRKIVFATNANKETEPLLNDLLHSQVFNLLKSDEDS
jgi:hypothetical protein